MLSIGGQCKSCKGCESTQNAPQFASKSTCLGLTSLLKSSGEKHGDLCRLIFEMEWVVASALEIGLASVGAIMTATRCACVRTRQIRRWFCRAQPS